MLLQVRDLGIAYGKGDPVVRHVSFDLDAGQVLAIVGESGSGKLRLSVPSSMFFPAEGILLKDRLFSMERIRRSRQRKCTEAFAARTCL